MTRCTCAFLRYCANVRYAGISGHRSRRFIRRLLLVLFLHRFPNAKLATMRNGGPFPFLAAADEVSMHVELHMRRCGAAQARPTKVAAARQQQVVEVESASWEQSGGSRQRGATFKLPSHEAFEGSRSKLVDWPQGLLTCSTHSSMGNCRSWGSALSQEYPSQAGLKTEQPPHPASPWYPEDKPLARLQQQP